MMDHSLLWLLCLTALACSEQRGHLATEVVPQLIESPANSNSGQANLVTSKDGQVCLTWLEPTDENSVAFRFSLLGDGGWSRPGTIATGENWIVYWADLPSLSWLRDGTMAAHWIGQATHLYDVNLAFSHDQGSTWTEPISPHRDGTDTEHGFASLLPWKENQVWVAWLDGRNHARDYDGPGKGDTALRFATITSHGEFHAETVLDPRVCDCCPTAAVLTMSGPVVAYRDRSDSEERDIAIVRFEDGAWTGPQVVGEDGWQIQGCPVNGPAISTEGNHLALAWFTGAKDQAAVKIVLSTDGGRSFGPPIQIDDGQPIGSPTVQTLSDGSALVGWMESTREGADFRLRRVSVDGTLGASKTINTKASATGMPRMIHQGEWMIFAWTQTGETKQVLTAKALLASL
ncbi:hypothetical protein MJD09_16995 [bacterium]|nr:hypothetical protein [bacterium]